MLKKGNLIDAKYCFIEEQKEGQTFPFVSYEGILLEDMIRNSGIKREECIFISLNSIDLVDIELIEEMKSVEFIICASYSIFKHLTGIEKALTDWRGSILKFRNKNLMLIYPLSSIIAQNSWKYITISDLKKLVDYKPPTEIIYNVLGFNMAMEMLRILYGKTVAIDIETTQDLHLKVIGFSHQDNFSYVVDVSKWYEAELTTFLYELQKLLNDSNTKIIMHNSAFDLKVLERYCVKCSNLWLDTMHAFHLLYAEYPKSLDFVQSIYTNIPFHKHLAETDLHKYNAYDTAITYLVHKNIIEELKEQNLYNFYFEYLHKLIYILKDMDKVKIDLATKNEIEINLTKEYQHCKDQLKVITDINPNSPKQVTKFFNELGFKITDSKDLTLKSLYKKKKSIKSLVDLILKLRTLNKSLGTYFDINLFKDGYLHTSYNISGTTSGRLSSSEDLFYDGLNIQNIPKPYRRMVIPFDTNNTFINADYNQAELRLVAMLSKEEKMLEIFKNDSMDIFKFIASLIFEIPIDEVDSEQRSLAKRVVHATNYGMGANTFSLYCEIPVKKAKEIKQAYTTNFPAIIQWQNDVINLVKKQKYLITPLGRKRWFYGRVESNVTNILSFLPQSTVADMSLMALINFCENKIYEEIKPIVHLHDAILVETPLEYKTFCIETLLKSMKIPLNINDNTYFIPVGYKEGKNWEEVS